MIEPFDEFGVDAVAVPVVRCRGELAELNAAATELLGVARRVSAAELARCVAPPDRARWAAVVAGAAGQPTVVGLDGPPPCRQIECWVRPADPGSDAAADVVVTLVDVTERERLRACIEPFTLGVGFFDAEHRTLWRAPLHGEAPEELAVTEGTVSLDFVHPDDRAHAERTLADLLRRPGEQRRMVLRVRPEGAEGWFPVECHSVARPDSQVVGGVITRWEPGSLDGEDETSPRNLAEVSSEGLLLFDAGGTLRYRNQRMAVLLGERAGTAGPASLVDAVAPDHRPALLEVVEAGLVGERRHVVVAAAGDATRWIRVTCVPVDAGRGGHGVSLAVAVADVTEETEATAALERARDELWHRAHHDQLTGLANRAYLSQQLATAVARHRAEPLAVALLSVDLDGFKAVNDELGHRAGDQVLVEVAARLADVAGDGRVVSRWGGDEFLVLWTDEDPTTLVAEVDRLVGEIPAAIRRPVATDAGRAVVGASVGSIIANGEEPDELLVAVDAAMYAAKRARTGGARP
ncbi:MAG: diguanylate cyclase [Acidimicrobiia bacterium]|nr:diguanylate cyclase [Acidimicrobiia bacterium]